MTKTTLFERALIRLSGEDGRGFLQGLVTNDVLNNLPVWAGLLTPQGKALFDFLIWADGDDLLIDCETGQAAALAKKLSLYRLRRPLSINVDATLAVHWAQAQPHGVSAHLDPRSAQLGWRWISSARDDDASADWLRTRLELGIVEGAAELGQDQSLWLECNAREQNGVSFTKGCYVGQENTARMHHRDKVNRKLAIIHADQDPGERTRIWYEDLKLAVIFDRVEP